MMADCYYCRQGKHNKCIDGKSTSRVCGCKH